MADPQGKNAVINGRRLEDAVSSNLMEASGLAMMKHREYVKTSSTFDVILTNAPFTTVYQTSGRTEFLVKDSHAGDVRIECKNQQVHGSVDEKVPYTLENLAVSPEKTCILVMDGDGFRDGAKQFARTKASKLSAEHDKTIHVFDLNEFKTWSEQYGISRLARA